MAKGVEGEQLIVFTISNKTIVGAVQSSTSKEYKHCCLGFSRLGANNPSRESWHLLFAARGVLASSVSVMGRGRACNAPFCCLFNPAPGSRSLKGTSYSRR